MKNAATWLLLSTSLALTLAPRPAHAWAIGSQLNWAGCHEPITASALRRARAVHPTAPVIKPTRDEAAMIADVIFKPPSDFLADLGGMALLLGVRDNDLKGSDPLQTLELTLVHGNPATQEEHCIRRLDDNGSPGDAAALVACSRFIVETATLALDGLDADGSVDPSKRAPLKLYTQVAGEISPPLPVFYVKMGMAMHALEDGFTHVYRTPDGNHVTTVLNWIDFANQPYDEAQDGPPHLPALDDCRNTGDPIIARNLALATAAATELLSVALDSSLNRAQKVAGFGAVTTKYLAYQPGCSLDNNWCDAPEETVTASAGCCSVGGDTPWGSLALVGGVVLASRLRRRRSSVTTGLLGLVLVGGVTTAAEADDGVTVPAAKHSVALRDSAEFKEEARTQTAAGDTGTWAFTGSIGGAIERTAVVGTIGARYRLSDSWLVGLDLAWNPWISTSPIRTEAGVFCYYATLIRRFPMKYERVNLRSSLHLGGSTLLFDVYGTSKYSTGVYAALSFLGVDIDLGKKVRLVIDPVEFAIPIPSIGQIPLWYEQFRFMVGLQIGV